MTTRTLALAFVTMSLLTAPASAAPAATVHRIEVHGHRGARGVRPENTLPAFEFALAQGVDVLELDLAVTADDALVISHDPMVTPERCVGLDGKPLDKPRTIRKLTLAEVRSYDCGRLKNPKFPRQTPVPGTSMPTLDELFARVASSPLPQAKVVRFNIETKIYPSKPELTPAPEEFARLVVGSIDKHGMTTRAIIQSFDDRTLKAVKKLAPSLELSLLTSDNHLDYVAAVGSIHGDILSPDADWILPEDVVALHRAHIQVVPWTVNEVNGWQRLVDMGVDAIISDVPDELIAFLKQKGLR